MTKVTVENKSDQVFLYEEESEYSEQLAELEDGDEVTILDIFENIAYVEYVDKASNVTYQGYLSNDYLTLNNFNKEDITDSFEKQEDSNQKKNKDFQHVKSDLEDSYTNKEEVTLDSNIKSNNEEVDEEINNTTKSKLSNSQQSFKLAKDSNSIQGYALKRPTYVYDSQSRNSKKLKSYEQGSSLKYKTLNSNWYQATIKYNGEWVTGYIHVNDVETFSDKQTTQNGLAAKSPTNVYQSPTKDKVLKSYKKGTILKYKTLTSEWVKATIKYDGEWVKATIKYDGEWITGYIHVNDVETFSDKQTTLNGLAAKSPTNVYQSPTKDKVLKSYKKGTILKYKTLTSEWVQATIKYNGEWVTGYIHVNDVETFPDKQTTQNGLAAKSPTNVYQSLTKDKVLKSYKKGTILKYKTLTSEWVQATIKYDGEWITGYIHVNDVETFSDKQTTLNGLAAKSPTNVYQSLTKDKVLKSNYEGTLVRYKTTTERSSQA